MRPTRCSRTTSKWFGNEHLIAQPKSVRSIELRARTRYTAHPMRDQVISERGKGEAVGRVVDDPDAPRALESARAALEQVTEWDAASIEEALRAACDETGLKPRVLFGPVRVAVSGRSVAPGLFESLALLGRDETLARIATLGRRFTVEG